MANPIYSELCEHEKLGGKFEGFLASGRWVAMDLHPSTWEGFDEDTMIGSVRLVPFERYSDVVHVEDCIGMRHISGKIIASVLVRERCTVFTFEDGSQRSYSAQVEPQVLIDGKRPEPEPAPVHPRDLAPGTRVRHVVSNFFRILTVRVVDEGWRTYTSFLPDDSFAPNGPWVVCDGKSIPILSDHLLPETRIRFIRSGEEARLFKRRTENDGWYLSSPWEDDNWPHFVRDDKFNITWELAKE